MTENAHNTQKEKLTKLNCNLIWIAVLAASLLVCVLGKEVLNGEIAVSLVLSLMAQAATI